MNTLPFFSIIQAISIENVTKCFKRHLYQWKIGIWFITSSHLLLINMNNKLKKKEENVPSNLKWVYTLEYVTHFISSTRIDNTLISI